MDEQKLRELIAKWRRWHKNAVDPAGGMSVKAMATGETIGKCADELEAALAASEDDK